MAGGRPKGSTTRPQIREYFTPEEIGELVAQIKEKAKEDPQLLKWLGDQIFGKPVQPIGNDDGKPLIVKFDNAFISPPEGGSK